MIDLEAPKNTHLYHQPKSIPIEIVRKQRARKAGRSKGILFGKLAGPPSLRVDEALTHLSWLLGLSGGKYRDPARTAAVQAFQHSKEHPLMISISVGGN